MKTKPLTLTLLTLLLLCTARSWSSPVSEPPHVFWTQQAISILQIHRDQVKVERLDPKRSSFRLDLPFLGRSCRIIRPDLVKPAPQRVLTKGPIFLLSDVHGRLDAFMHLLTTHGVLDRKGRWAWGKGTLVVLGDLFDRGTEVTELLWLVYTLQEEASRKGGAVHFVLGNHEIMVLSGDLRYVHKRYRKLEQVVGLALPDIYGKDTILGHWLRTRPVMMLLNRNLLVHGGICPGLMDHMPDPETVNQTIWPYLAQAVIERPQEEGFIKDLWGKMGPWWCRGFFQDPGSAGSTPPEMLGTYLQQMGADQIIVGHTTQDQVKRVAPYQGNVIAIDAGLQKGDQGEGLIITRDGQFMRATWTGDRLLLPRDQLLEPSA